jgi:hypothetical protein
LSGIDPDEVESLSDKLWDLTEDKEVYELRQLFSVLGDMVGAPAEGFTPEGVTDTMCECYYAIRDCQDLPEFPIGTPESIILDQERANANCMRAIEFQKRLVREAVQQQQ